MGREGDVQQRPHKPSAALTEIGKLLGMSADEANRLTKQICRRLNYPPLTLFEVRCRILEIVQPMSLKGRRRLSVDKLVEEISLRLAGPDAIRLAPVLNITPIQARVLLDAVRDYSKKRDVGGALPFKGIVEYLIAHHQRLKQQASGELAELIERVAAEYYWHLRGQPDGVYLSRQSAASTRQLDSPAPRIQSPGPGAQSCVRTPGWKRVKQDKDGDWETD